MPSASTKVEIPASSEALDPFKRVLTVVDKKVRNLEKRKLKLDVLRQKKDSGGELEKDQQNAVDRYGEVIQNLEFARDLQKQFQCISTDVEKLLKKQAKRGKSEKQMQEVKRVKEVLQLQGLLDQMGSETVRKDFQTGKHGAIVLTEENLDQLDELYKMISPTRDGESDYLESLSEASEHIVCLLDAKDKPVVGTTSYKDLKELLDLISQCGYFEKAQATEGVVKEVGDVEFEVVEHTDVPAPDSEEVQSSLPPEVPAEEEETEPVATGQQTINSNDTLNTQPQVITAEADAFFNTPVSSQTVEEQQAELAALQQQQRRPFQEIVSSVQGNFNFLQESTIEVEAKREFSPHMDPAVVAAHPMPQSQQSIGRPPSNQTPDTSSLHQTGFGSGTTFGEQQSAFGDQQSLDSEISVSKVSHGGSDKSVYSQANMAPTQDFSGSGFTQSNLSHSLQTDSLFSGTVSSSDSNSGNRGMIGKGESANLGHTQYEIPPQLPMPPSHEQQAQDNQHQTDSEKKGFNMNPNATEFQSLIYNQSGEEGESSNKSSNDGFQGGTYSNMNYNQREQRGGRGGFRGGRGGNRGGNMSNGYSRGGRGNYQGGYQSRDNYRSDGFQGNYSGNNYNNGGFQKRGESGREGGRGGSRGGNRGGQRGGGGFNRGGNTTGGRGSARGTGQGFGRPNFNQQQQ